MVNDMEFKICQLADDTTLFLKDKLSLELTINHKLKFERLSGLKLNLEKTEIIPIGKTLGKSDIVILLHNIQSKSFPFKALGIWFAKDSEETATLNYKNTVSKAKKELDIWCSRNLSIKGKITVIKSVIVPKFVHLFNSTFTPNHTLQEIHKMIVNFIWNNKTPKVKFQTMIGDFGDGGLKLPDIYVVTELKI